MNLISATGNTVHAPAMADQTGTTQTACAPFGRMGARRPSYRWTNQFEVTCKSCLRAQA